MPSLQQLISKRFPDPEYVVFFEVAASGRQRYADAIAFGIWPSRGLLVHGFECKSSRADWLRELKAPEKAEPLHHNCDRWWLVAERDVAKEEEIPEAWGWLERKGDKLYQRKKAPALERPPTMSKAFAANLLRRINDSYILRAVFHEKLESAVATERERLEQRHDPHAPALRRELDALQARVKEFEKASGVQIDSWKSGTEIGNAFRIAIQIDKERPEEFAKRLDWTRSQIASMLKSVDEVITELRNYERSAAKEGTGS